MDWSTLGLGLSGGALLGFFLAIWAVYYATVVLA